MLLTLVPLVFTSYVTALQPDSRPMRLARALVETAPRYLDKPTAIAHAISAAAVETREVPAELLLGLAYYESRYEPRTTSRLRDGVRRTGVPKWTTPPKSVRGPYYCGVTQADAGRSWSHCEKLRAVPTAYAKTVDELVDWRRICRHKYKTSDVTRCSLYGYVGGLKAITKGTSTYPRRVLWRAGKIRRAATPPKVRDAT